MNGSLKFSPRSLTEEERNHPYTIFEDFFNCFHLQDIHEMLWDWLVAALSSESGAYGSGRARSNLIFSYEKMLLLAEAANTINRRQKKRRRRNNSKHAANF